MNSPSDPKPFLRALAGQTAGNPPPVWMMRQAGRYMADYRAVRATAPDFISFCLNPELASTVTLQPIQRFGFDAAILFADILLVPMMFGQQVRFLEGEGPVMGPLPDLHPWTDKDVTAALQPLRPIAETVQRVKDQLPKHVALIGFAGAPWTVLTYMLAPNGKRDHDHAIRQVYADPEGINRWLSALVEATAHYLAMQVEAGAEALQIFDSWSEGLAEPLFDQLIIAPHQALLRRLAELGVTVPIIGFPRGAGGHYSRYVQSVPVAGVGIDTSVPIAQGQELQRHCTIQGNLDPLLLRAGGPALDQRIDQLISAYGAGPYVFNLGHGILPDTPMAHVDQMLKRIRS